ncbi:DNA helicase protein [Dioscorea alata]|uniref:DNA helicase protein n=1 Tax=Dioscorea alata TaxID=55571 RepID=A0ACB7VA72_DIOAL|nr:DNA helicase protein [Dioscorea alata]
MPSFLRELFDGNCRSRCSQFKERIRIYNSIFQFTSLGAIVDNSINHTNGPYDSIVTLDIIIEHREEGLKRISDLHPLFMLLQYPLIFPYDICGNSIGKQIILPASFIPAPRYMFENYPKLFITFTCNPRWTEILDALRSIKKQKPEDRPDLVSRLPNKEFVPITYDAVSSFMMNGPCGLANLQAPCMEKGKCKKFYPKSFRNSTIIDEDGFPQYRNTSAIALHNEVCNNTRAIKYLFKYINKGPYRARVIFEESTSLHKMDEIKNYLDCRYLSAYENCWRLFEFSLHHREPSVQRLLIHLPEEHNIYFSDRQSIPGIISNPDVEKTIGRSLLYADFPTKFTWYQKYKKWEYRKNDRSIGRIIYVHPSAGELYYLHLLLNEIKGATSYEDLRAINGITYTTYKETCFVLGILGDDSEWLNALTQASHWATGAQLRQLFVTIILFYNYPRIENLADLYVSTNITDWLFHEELNYNILQLRKDHLLMLSKLNLDQLIIYNEIQQAVNNNKEGMFFVYGHGGTEKTFLWTTIINGIRFEGKIVLAVASLGIASLLLPGGKTTHSRFKIPTNIGEYSTCTIPKQTKLARLIAETTLIVWDEAPMIHKNCLEALNRTLQDIILKTIIDASTKPFGGKTILLGGDFQQILPIIQSGTKIDIINATITQSQLWKECKSSPNKGILTMDITNCLDYISKSSTSTNAHEPLYSTEFLNTLKFTNVSDHELNLKLGCEIMLMSNISQGNGLCNGTRLIVTQIHPNILEAKIISRSNIGDKVYIPRIIMAIEDKKLPFVMCRKQFLVRLSYAMTINKSQGQTLDLVGLFLPRPVFTHGQLYVALFRVTSATGL